MKLSHWLEEPIGRNHDRLGFDCGNRVLNEFLRQHARRNHERGGSKTFLAIDPALPGGILGFYTLSPASMEFDRTPEVVRRGLGRYDVAGFRLGRLAVATSFQGQGLGGQLLLAAARRCIRASTEVGGSILIIDANNAKVAAWYASYGAIALPEVPLTLFLPLSTASALLASVGKL